MSSKNVTITQEAYDAIRAALNAADKLVSLTISGQPGAMRQALDTARALSVVDKRAGLYAAQVQK
jgi:hypothetical protein